MATFTVTCSFGSYLPFGFVAAKTVHFVFNLHTRPAYRDMRRIKLFRANAIDLLLTFATLIVCCSMAS